MQVGGRLGGGAPVAFDARLITATNADLQAAIQANRFRIDLYHRVAEFVRPPAKRHEITNVVAGGLQDLSVSRARLPWGIPWPGDPGHTVYVWFDALINYASAVGLGTDDGLFARWWPADLHVIGKDITRFHAVVWPAMLMSAVRHCMGSAECVNSTPLVVNKLKSSMLEPWRRWAHWPKACTM